MVVALIGKRHMEMEMEMEPEVKNVLEEVDAGCSRS